jgi:hypothetical protein
MTQAANESRSPLLFAHTGRKDWGVGVLAWEADGKRGYLFENGEERTMANGYFELMRRVEQPSAAERAAYARLQGILAKRASARASTQLGATFADQVAKFRETYPDGLQDPKWITEVRGEGVERRTPRHRDAILRDAKEQLSAKALDALIGNQRHDHLWNQVTSVLGRTDLVPASQLRKPKAVDVQQQRVLAVAVRDLLHGETPYEQRFERYLGALAGFYGEPARWEIATALSALVHPSEHVCVSPTIFRQHLKATGSRGTVAAKPSSAAYTRLLVVARFVSGQLVGQGEEPRDLLDVRDFMQAALKAPPKARVTKASSGRTERAVPDEDSANEDSADNDDD